MKKHFSTPLLLLALMCAAVQMRAQDPIYSQFYSNMVMLNPAFAGAASGPRAALNFRNQWARIPGNFKQVALSADMPLYFLGSNQGAGITVMNDIAGEGQLTKLDVVASYAYEIQLNKQHAVRLGVSGGIQQASVNWAQLRFPDQIDPVKGLINATKEPIGNYASGQIRPDVNAGISYYNKYAWAGLTVNHITQPNQVLTGLTGVSGKVDPKLPRKYSLTGGMRIPLGDFRDPNSMSITPAFLFINQGQFNQLNVGAYFDMAPMTFGVWYRHQDAMIGMIGVKTGPLRIGYSYDATVGKLTQRNTGGSHELSVVVELERDKRKRGMKHRSLPCPKF